MSLKAHTLEDTLMTIGLSLLPLGLHTPTSICLMGPLMVSFAPAVQLSFDRIKIESTI